MESSAFNNATWVHLSVLIETMRREGYELQVGQPQVIYKEIDGVIPVCIAEKLSSDSG